MGSNMRSHGLPHADLQRGVVVANGQAGAEESEHQEGLGAGLVSHVVLDGVRQEDGKLGDNLSHPTQLNQASEEGRKEYLHSIPAPTAEDGNIEVWSRF